MPMLRQLFQMSSYLPVFTSLKLNLSVSYFSSLVRLAVLAYVWELRAESMFTAMWGCERVQK